MREGNSFPWFSGSFGVTKLKCYVSVQVSILIFILF